MGQWCLAATSRRSRVDYRRVNRSKRGVISQIARQSKYLTGLNGCDEALRPVTLHYLPKSPKLASYETKIEMRDYLGVLKARVLYSSNLKPQGFSGGIPMGWFLGMFIHHLCSHGLKLSSGANSCLNGSVGKRRHALIPNTDTQLGNENELCTCLRLICETWRSRFHPFPNCPSNGSKYDEVSSVLFYPLTINLSRSKGVAHSASRLIKFCKLITHSHSPILPLFSFLLLPRSNEMILVVVVVCWAKTVSKFCKIKARLVI